LSWRAVHIEDTELIARARAGDVVAYEAIVRRYQDVAVRTAHLICPETDADDAVRKHSSKPSTRSLAFAKARPCGRGCSGSSRMRRVTGVAPRSPTWVGPSRRGGDRAEPGSAGPEQIVMAAEQRAELMAALRNVARRRPGGAWRPFPPRSCEAETAETLGIRAGP
jgi:hypothetical protein